MGEKQPRSDRWRRFWHWHGFEIVIILALAVGYAVFSFVPADVLFGHGSSSSAVSSSSTTPFHDVAVIGSSDGIDIGRSDGFDAGVSAGESFSSPRCDFVHDLDVLSGNNMTSAMDASIPVDGFLAILTAIFLSTPKSMSTISLTTSFIRSRMSIQMI